MKYRSCPFIENFALHFIGRIDTNAKCMTLCCESTPNIPGVALCGTARESMEAFRRERSELIAESQRFSLRDFPESERRLTSGCAKCVRFQSGDYDKSDGLIYFVSLGMLPAPCQCKCIYCNISLEDRALKKRYHADYYKKVFDILDYANSAGMIASNAKWHVAGGEISIHPYREKILDLVKSFNVDFFTNCFIFDEKVAEILAGNPNSALFLSIDSGTSETWHKVKGVDNFEVAMENLVKYYKVSENQINLKYIVLPGINDNLTDYISTIEIMKVLNIRHLDISCNDQLKYTGEQKEPLISAAAYLAAMLIKNGMTFLLVNYMPDETEAIAARGCELLQLGELQ